MKVGTVTGSVWATRKASCLQGQTFLVVRTEYDEVVAADCVGAGAGDCVLVVLGATARYYCDNAPVDAAVVAIVDTKKE
ncbi:MAG: EutN/CcmL family microcompartment protein [Oscillospiraceae bacterium]|nr:EutN/CcmL family microcompartment protein [Oscillospiraceae bacterium]